MNDYVHARLDKGTKNILKTIQKKTKQSSSEIVRRGLNLVYQQEMKGFKTAMDVAGDLAGKYSSKYTDLSTNKKHMEGFGED